MPKDLNKISIERYQEDSFNGVDKYDLEEIGIEHYWRTRGTFWALRAISERNSKWSNPK